MVGLKMTLDFEQRRTAKSPHPPFGQLLPREEAREKVPKGDEGYLVETCVVS